MLCCQVYSHRLCRNPIVPCSVGKHSCNIVVDYFNPIVHIHSELASRYVSLVHVTSLKLILTYFITVSLHVTLVNIHVMLSEFIVTNLAEIQQLVSCSVSKHSCYVVVAYFNPFYRIQPQLASLYASCVHITLV